MKIFFTGQPPRLPEPDSQRTGSIELPQSVLDRHRARVLSPADAPLAPGASRPGSTVYRYGRLLASDRLLDNDSQLSELDGVLNAHDVQIDREHLDRRDRTQRVHIKRTGSSPDTVDAWRVLQTLRGSVDAGECAQELYGRLRLEHLLVGSAFQGVGASWVGTEKGGAPGGAGPAEGRDIGGAYPNRFPVDLPLAMAARRPASAIPGGRRPVVAVLDTGVARAHPALDASDRQENRDTFVTVDTALQEQLSAGADPEAPAIDGPWDSEPTDDDLNGEITTHFGHGTFISGLIRQLAPDAQVRSIRIMYNDGVAYEHECLGALHALADEAERAREGDDTAEPVDVVCLSFGYVDEDSDDKAHGALRAAILRLTELGVPVVCSAGNFGSTRPFYPAAFCAEPQPAEAAPIISVGALNPNHTAAYFSNDGPWVTAFASGAALVSTFPIVEGARNPAYTNTLGGRHRESLDPDDYRSGFALWSGTSFSAPLVAASLADAMLRNADIVDLSARDALTTTHRVQSALKLIGGS